VQRFDATGRDLAVLYIAMLVSRVGFGVIVIIFPFYISKSSDITVALALAMYPLLEAATAVPMGKLCDSRGRKGIFVVSLGSMAILMAAIGLSRNLYAVAAIHALMGAGAAGVTVSTLAMVTDLTARENRGAGMGTFDFANVGGYAVGLLLGGKLDAAFGSNLSVAFYVTSVVLVAAFAAAAVVLKEPSRPSGRVEMSLNPFTGLDSKSKAIIPIWLGAAVLLGTVFFLPRALTKVGVGGSLTAEILLAGILILGTGSVGFGALSDVIGRGKVLLIGVAGLFGLILSLGPFLQRGVAGLVANLPLVGVSTIAASALVPAVLATVGDRAPGEQRGSAMGVYNMMLSGGTALGTILAGLAHRASGMAGIIEVALVTFAVACVASLTLWILVTRREALWAERDMNPPTRQLN
jgi:MFS family permease